MILGLKNIKEIVEEILSNKMKKLNQRKINLCQMKKKRKKTKKKQIKKINNR